MSLLLLRHDSSTMLNSYIFAPPLCIVETFLIVEMEREWFFGDNTDSERERKEKIHSSRKSLTGTTKSHQLLNETSIPSFIFHLCFNARYF